MSYTKAYTTREQRNQLCDEANANGYEMLHDDFTDTGGLLTFGLPVPKTPEEINAELEVQAREEAIAEITAKKLIQIKARNK